MGHKFSLVLSREITDDESVILQEVGCAGATFAVDSLPTNAGVPVTKMDVDNVSSPSLAEAIESAIEAVRKLPDISVPGLSVPAQIAQAASGESKPVLGGVLVTEGQDPAETAAEAE